MLEPLYPRKSTPAQPLTELLHDIKFEFRRLGLAGNIKLIGSHACVEIFQEHQNLKFSHPAQSLLSILQMYE
jgi:hypothetical protein